MAEKVVVNRYSKALFEVALEKKLVDAIDGELSIVSKTFRENSDVQSFFAQPKIARFEKIAFIDRVFKGKLADILLNFLYLLLKKRRIDLLPEIYKAFLQLKNEHNKITPARVTTAIELTPEIIGRLKDSLEKLTGETILINTRVDDRIIGGMVVKIGDRVIDRSVRQTLAGFRERLLSVNIFAE